GYTGTPAVSVNDTLLEGFAPVILNAAIDEALGIAPTEETAPDDASAEPTDESTEESSDS
ncbi:MAG: hypothetical protein KC708_24810, partial [Anaerolineae bacterium]|nr:hypothetical protein [Anaerolineae bacterium]